MAHHGEAPGVRLFHYAGEHLEHGDLVRRTGRDSDGDGVGTQPDRVLHGGDGGVVGRVEFHGEHRGLQNPGQRRAVAAEQRTGQSLGDGDGVRLAFGDAGEGRADGGQPGGDTTRHRLVEGHRDRAAVSAEEPAQAQVSTQGCGGSGRVDVERGGEGGSHLRGAPLVWLDEMGTGLWFRPRD